MNAAERAGGVVMVHAEDNCIINFNTRRLYAEGREAGRNIHLARPPLAEEAAIRRMILLAERSGCPLYVVHVSSESGAAAIAEARRGGCRSFGEVLHNYLAFTSEDYAKPDGTLYHNYPPLKSPADQDALWSAIALGDLDTVASDDFTIPRSSKLSGLVVDNVPGGHNGIETRMDVLFSEGVAKNRLTIEQFVQAHRRGARAAVRALPAQGRASPSAATPTSSSSTRRPGTRSASTSCTPPATTASGTAGSSPAGDGDRAARAGAGGGRQLGRPAAHRRFVPAGSSASPPEPRATAGGRRPLAQPQCLPMRLSP